MLDYFDDPSRRPRKKQNPPRIYTLEELQGLRRAAEISRARWRAELAQKGQPVYEAKKPRPRIRKKPRSEADERAKFASALARAEFRRSYWSGEQDSQLRLAMNRRKAPGTVKKPK